MGDYFEIKNQENYILIFYMAYFTSFLRGIAAVYFKEDF